MASVGSRRIIDRFKTSNVDWYIESIFTVRIISALP